MPTYGESKVKDMVRSVLPSTKRNWARLAKQENNKAKRRNDREVLFQMETDEDYDFSDSYHRYRSNGITRERREADKVKPLMRWAPKVTKGLHDKRRAQLQAMLPDNAIGLHALSHVEQTGKFQNPNVEEAWRNHRNWGKYRQPEVTVDYKSILKEVCIYLHAEFNDFIVGRKLLGIHDIDAFWEDIVKASRMHYWPDTSPKARAIKFLDKFKESNFDVYEFKAQLGTLKASVLFCRRFTETNVVK